MTADDIVMLIALLWIIITGLIAVVPLSIIAAEMDENK